MLGIGTQVNCYESDMNTKKNKQDDERRLETYYGLCTEYYDLDKPEAPPDALAYYLKCARAADGPILEPMCGSGNFLIPMLKEKLTIEGLDASPNMLAACQKRCLALGLAPILHEQFLDQMDLKKQYSLIFIPSGSFGLLLDEKSINKALKRVHDHLLPNGKFIFEVEALEAKPDTLNVWQDSCRKRKDGSKILLHTLSSFDESTHILHVICKYESIKNGDIEKTEVEDFRVKFYEYDEMDAYLEKAGFSYSKYHAYTGKKSSSVDHPIIYECRKR